MNVALVIIIVVLVAALWLRVRAVLLPHHWCRWCKGTGKLQFISSRKRWGDCPFCGGTGQSKRSREKR